MQEQSMGVFFAAYTQFLWLMIVFQQEHRKQILHQALVTGFHNGLFVTTNVEDGEGSVIQIVVVTIPDFVRQEHGYIICRVVEPMRCWFHRQDIIDAGFLVDEDFPAWMGSKQREILKSRAKLYPAHLRLITRADGSLQPTKPLLLYKHSTQYRYNKSKPGLDNNTTATDSVSFSSRGSFESKYVLRLLDGVLVV
jgi:hypothetical protein